MFGACAGGDVSLPPDGQPATLTVLEGNEQTGRVGDPLALPLLIEVADSRGEPVAGATVAFEFGSAGPGAAVVPEQKTTNAAGQADARLVLGTTVGRQTGQVRVVSPAGSSPVQASFSAIALSENANSMAAAGGQDQTGHVLQPLSDRLVVEVTDGFGNPVAGVPISWQAVGGGSVSENLVPTDEDGRARVDRILGPTVGQQTTLASSEGLAGSPVAFVHTAVAGDAFLLTIVSGDDQTGEVGTLLPGELVVRLIDSEGNGVPNTAVTWASAIGGGSPNPQNTTTDSDGRTSTQWTLGLALGDQRMDAVVSGVSVASFTATATAGAPASLSIRTQPSAAARNGIPLERQPVIQLRDPQGNDAAVAGVQVTASLNGGGELEGTTRQTTDVSGRAAFTDLAIAGDPGIRTLVFEAVGYAPVTSDEISVSAIGTTTTITGDSPDPSQVGTPFTVSFRVESEGPTPTGSVTVGDGTQSCAGALSNGAGSCLLSLSTVGARTLTAVYSGAPGLSGSSDTEPHTVTAAPPPPPASTTTTITSDEPDPSVSGSTVTVSVRVTSQAGTPTGNVTISVSGGSATCTITLSAGEGSCPMRLDAIGERTFTATYQGAPGFGGSSDTEAHRVDAPASENDEPVADFNWDCVDLTCSFTDNSRDPNGNETITRRVWELGDGTTITDQVSFNHTYASPGNYRVVLTVTDNGNLSDQSEDVVDPSAPPPQTLQIRDQPSSSATIGEAFDRQPEIELRAGDDDLERAGVTITASIASGAGTLGGTTTATTDSDGRAQFSDLSISGATGPHTLRFTAEGFGEVTSNTIDVRKESSRVSINSFDPDEPTVGETVRIGFSVIGSGGPPTGNVTVTADDPGESCTGTVADGFCNIVFTASGDRDLTATYEGDGRFEGDTDTEDIQVDPATPANQPPTANDDAALTAAGTSVTIPVRANDTDPEGAVLSIIDVSDPVNGSVVNNGDGTITYTPDAGFGGATDIFTYSASDGSFSDEATVNVQVDAVNEVPNAVIGSISCTGMTCTFADASIDPDGDETIAEWNWLFGDGASSTERNPVHSYAEPNEYDVQLRVTDSGGLSGADLERLTVAVEDGGGAEG